MLGFNGLMLWNLINEDRIGSLEKEILHEFSSSGALMEGVEASEIFPSLTAPPKSTSFKLSLYEKDSKLVQS